MSDLVRQRAATVAVWRADVGHRPAGAWTDLGGLALHATGIPVAQWNGAHLTDPVGLLQLEQAGRWFAGRGLPWGLLVPHELALEPAGWEHVTDQGVMLRSLDDLPPAPELDLRWDDAAGAAAVQSEAFGDPLDVAREFVLPKTRVAEALLVTAHEQDGPVATATGFVVDGVCAVYGVGTRVSARRRGFGRAVTLAVLHAARQRGADLAFLNPSDEGHGTYARLGFTDAPGWRVWRPLQEGAGPAEAPGSE